jgi:hypothetical protein
MISPSIQLAMRLNLAGRWPLRPVNGGGKCLSIRLQFMIEFALMSIVAPGARIAVRLYPPRS